MGPKGHKDPDARELFEQGKAFFVCDEYPQALNRFIEAEKKDPALKGLSLYTGKTYVKLGQTHEAIHFFQQELSHHESEETWCDLVEAYLDVGDITAAQYEAAVGVKKFPESSKLFCLLGLSHERRGSPGMAEKCFEVSANLDPTYLSPLISLADLAAKSRCWSRAHRFYKQALELNPDIPELLRDMAVVCFHLRLHDEAKEFMGRFFLADPDSKNFDFHNSKYKN